MLPRREAPVDPVSRMIVSARTLRPLALGAALVLTCFVALCPFNPAQAKKPGGVHCYGKTCHRVSTIEEMVGSVGRFGILKASFYDDCRVDRFNACGLTSSGELFRPGEPDNAASPIFPDGTVLLAFNAATKKAAVLRVNSAGPYWGDRKLDVSRAAAEKLGFRKKGVAELMVAIIYAPSATEARYSKKRRYARVPGYLGTFPTFEAAHETALARLALKDGSADGLSGLLMQQMQVAALEPEVELRSIAPWPYLQARPSRKELQQQTIFYSTPLEPQEFVPAVDVGQGTTDSIAAPSSDSRTQVNTDVAIETYETHGARDEVVIQIDAPVVVVTAREPAFWALGLGVTFDADGFWQRFKQFLADARDQAQPRGTPLELPPIDEWSPRAEAFVEQARAKARAGATRSGPLYELFADLKLKAQAVRD